MDKAEGYAAAITEVAQPLQDRVEELEAALKELAESIDGYSYDQDLACGAASAFGRIASDARAILAKHA